MSISLQALEAALSSIEEVGKGESTFDVSGVSVTLRILLPEEEHEVQRFAGEAMKGGTGDDDISAVDFLDRFKVEVISRSLVAVGDQDFRGVEFIETGEVLDNGKPVQIPKVKALKKMVQRWAGTLRVLVFRKYAELLNRVDREAEKAVLFEPSDIDAEITRLEERLEELRDEKSKIDSPARGGLADTVDRVATYDGETQETRQKGVESHLSKASKTEPPEQPEPEPDFDTSQPILPTSAPPPPPPKATTPGRPRQQAAPAQPRPPMVQDESLVDSSDMAAAAAAEHDRLVRERYGGEVAQQPPSALAAAQQAGTLVQHRDANSEFARGEYTAATPVRPSRVPPHAEAAAAAREIEAEEAERIQVARQVGTRDGIDAYARPIETLSQPAQQKVPVTPPASVGTKNPRFKPRKKTP